MITFVLDSGDMFDAVAWIYGRDRTMLTLQEFFRRVTICFKHPIFYYNLIKELLQEADDPEKFIAGDVLGSILECNVRGVWSKFIKSPMMYEHHYFDNENNIMNSIALPYPELCLKMVRASNR